MNAPTRAGEIANRATPRQKKRPAPHKTRKPYARRSPRNRTTLGICLHQTRRVARFQRCPTCELHAEDERRAAYWAPEVRAVRMLPRCEEWGRRSVIGPACKLHPMSEWCWPRPALFIKTTEREYWVNYVTIMSARWSNWSALCRGSAWPSKPDWTTAPFDQFVRTPWLTGGDECAARPCETLSEFRF